MSNVKLTDIPNLFRDVIDDYRSNHPLLSPNDDPRDNALKSYLESIKTATSWEQVVSLNFLMSPNWWAGFDGVEKLGGPPGSHDVFAFDQGGTGWYFLYGLDADPEDALPQGFTFIIFWRRLMSNKMASRKALNGAESSVFWFTGGFTNPQGDWIPISKEVNGVKLSYASSGSYTGIGSPTKISFRTTDSSSPLQVSFTATKGLSSYHLVVSIDRLEVINVAMTNAPSNTFYNGKGGCVPCASGAGTLYWSNMDYSLDTSQKSQIGTKPFTGKKVVGWLDHQWGRFGPVLDAWFPQLFLTWARWTSLRDPIVRWLFITVQPIWDTKGEKDNRYWIFIPLSYDQMASLKKGSVLDTSNVNVNRYCSTTNTVNYGIGGFKITLEEVDVGVSGFAFPASIKIEFGSRRLSLTRFRKKDGKILPGNGLVYVEVQVNQECPAILRDDEDGSLIGTGFLEANGFEKTDKITKDKLQVATGNTNSLSSFLPRKLTFKEAAPTFFVTLGWILLFLGIVLAIIIVPIVLVKRHKKKKMMKESNHITTTQENSSTQE